MVSTNGSISRGKQANVSISFRGASSITLTDKAHIVFLEEGPPVKAVILQNIAPDLDQNITATTDN